MSRTNSPGKPATPRAVAAPPRQSTTATTAKPITPRFTEAQIQPRLASLQAEIERLQAENRRLRDALQAVERRYLP